MRDASAGQVERMNILLIVTREPVAIVERRPSGLTVSASGVCPAGSDEVRTSCQVDLVE
jgi:hypothetical protein